MSRQSELAQLGRVFDTGPLSNRNLIINGAMQVAQRGTSFDPQGTGNAEGYTVDRFAWVRREQTGSGFTFDATITQDADSPSGFDKSLKVVADTTQSALSLSENAIITTKFEGQDLQRFGWGAADASAVTLSFWVKSNKTGTYCVQTRYNNNSDSGLFEYSVSASGTWEYKTITIPANTSVSFNSNNTLEMEVMFHLAVGPDDITAASSSVGTSNFRATSNQINLFDAASNYWQITGVQLEVGDTATPFEHRSYADELARCQRYYWKGSFAGGGVFGGGGSIPLIGLTYTQKMRITPSVTYFSGGVSSNGAADYTITGIYALVRSSDTSTRLLFTQTGSATNSQGCDLSGAVLSLDAEL